MIGPLLGRDVYLESLGAAVLRHVPGLLPDDPEYLGLRHFASARSGLFLDVGAGFGLAAMSFRRFDQVTPILALEPDPNHTGALIRLKRRDARFDFRIAAAGSARGYMLLHVPFIGSLALHTLASDSLPALQESCALAVAPRYHLWLTVRSYHVEVIRIDDLGLAPSIIKIDGRRCASLRAIDAARAVEAVLIGAEATLARSRPCVLVESHQAGLPGVEERLAGLCYERLSYRPDRRAFSTQPGSSRNAFFVPREATGRIPMQ